MSKKEMYLKLFTLEKGSKIGVMKEQCSLQEFLKVKEVLKSDSSKNTKAHCIYSFIKTIADLGVFRGGNNYSVELACIEYISLTQEEFDSQQKVEADFSKRSVLTQVLLVNADRISVTVCWNLHPELQDDCVDVIFVIGCVLVEGIWKKDLLLLKELDREEETDINAIVLGEEQQEQISHDKFLVPQLKRSYFERTVLRGKDIV